MANSEYVSTGKPKVTGAIYRALITDSLDIPTSATSELSSDYIPLGYVGDDGLTNSNTRTSEDFKAWGGDTVLSNQNEYSDKYSFKLIEILNTDVLKTVRGEDNVSGSLETGITVKANSAPLTEYCWVIEMIMRNGVLERQVIPRAQISEIGDIVYSDADLTAFDVTITAFPDTAGNTHYEYIQNPPVVTV